MATIVISKARVFGECINSWELLQALNAKVFKSDDAPVQVSTQFHSDYLKLVCLCSECNRIHLIAGQLTPNDHYQKLQNIRVLVDHTKDGKNVTRGELIAALELIGNVRLITLHNAQDDKAYTLTQVLSCSPACASVHLESAYEKNCLDLN